VNYSAGPNYCLTDGEIIPEGNGYVITYICLNVAFNGGTNCITGWAVYYFCCGFVYDYSETIDCPYTSRPPQYTINFNHLSQVYF